MSRIEEAELLAAKVIIAGFEGASLPEELSSAARKGALGGVILFKRNIESTGQLCEMLHGLRASAPDDRKPIAAVDQEGGRVARIGAPVTLLPSARKLGEIDDPRLTETAGRLVGRGLRALGFTLNFAPVLDVDTREGSTIIGDRAFGRTASQVIRHGLAFGRGLKDGGIVPCAKHFPGHGDASLDSHEALPRVEHGRARLEQVEMEPFAAWARLGVGAVMTAHILFPALDPDNPATISRSILHGELRKRLGWKGPILSDDLEMGAVGQFGEIGAVAVQAIRAGADGLLVCRTSALRRAVAEALAKEAAGDALFSGMLAQAAKRLATLAYPPGAPIDASWFQSDEHEALRRLVAPRLEGHA